MAQGDDLNLLVYEHYDTLVESATYDGSNFVGSSNATARRLAVLLRAIVK